MKTLPFGYMTAAAGLENVYSMEFDGVDEYMLVSDSPISTIAASTEFSISLWYYMPASITSFIFSEALNVTFELYSSGGSGWYMYVGPAITMSSVPPIITGKWVHVAIIVDQGSSVTFHQTDNLGTTVYTSTNTPTTLTPGSNPLYIGKRKTGTPYPFAGKLDELAFFDYELTTSADTTADLNSMTTPPIVWYRMGDNGRFLRKQWLLPAEANKDKSQNYSMYFDSVGTTFVLPNAALDIIPPATTKLTFSIWITKKNDLGWKGLYFCEGGSNDFFVALIGADIYFSSGAGNNGIVDFAVGSGFPLDDWYNITFFYDGTFIDGDPATQNAGRLKCYINGAPQAITFAGNIDSSLNPTYAWSSIGTYSNGAPNYYGFEGLMSGLAIWKSNQIANIAEIYGGGTPPDLTDLNPDNWWKLGDESRLHDGPFFCTEQKNVNKVGNYSFGSALITGANIAISGNPASLQITAAPLSISYWVYNNYESGGSSYLFVKGDNQTTQDYSLLQSSSTPSFVIRSGGTAYTVTGTTNTQDGWHHILGVYDGGDLKIYVDGDLENTNTIGSLSIDNIQTTSGIMSNGVTSICRGNHATAAIYNTDQSSNAVALFNLGEPVDESTYSPVAYWRADKAIYNTVGSNWDLPDQIGSADAVASFGGAGSGNFNLSGFSPNGANNALSQNTVATYRVGEAPNSNSNIVSYNMEEADRKEDTPV